VYLIFYQEDVQIQFASIEQTLLKHSFLQLMQDSYKTSKRGAAKEAVLSGAETFDSLFIILLFNFN
jgi:hypothetical protein